VSKEQALLELAKPEVASDYSKLSEAQQAIDQLDEQINIATAQWEEVLMELEELESD